MAVSTELLDRVKVRLNITPEDISKDAILDELLVTVMDRVKLRVGEKEFPDLLNSIAVDATVKAYNRKYYEGISSEGDDGISTSFVEDILFEYQSEFEQFIQSFSSKGKVKFI